MSYECIVTFQFKIEDKNLNLNLNSMRSQSQHELAYSLNNLVNIASKDNFITDYVIMSLTFIQQTLVKPNIQQRMGPPLSVPPYITSAPSLEKQKLAMKLNGFDYKTSDSWKSIVAMFGSDIKRTTLCEIAKFIASKKGIRMDRDSKRRKDVLLKWYSDNWADCIDILKKVKVKDDVPIFPNI